MQKSFSTIIVILAFLIICVLIFYYCFFPDGIPDHLKEDKPSEKSEKDEDEEDMMMDKEENDAANGNGT